MEKLPVYLLDISEDDIKSGVDRISFLSDGNPAIEFEWTMFNALKDSFNDYPAAASSNACRALKYKEKEDPSCGTLVGWKRANQLCNRQNISIETISRMASFKRHQQHKNVPYNEGCGGLMWDAWGGDEGINWALRKMERINHQMWNNNMSKVEFQSINDEKRIITTPIMLANTEIPRYHPSVGKYFVKFTPKAILKMMVKYFKQNKIHRINEDHNPDKVVDGVYMIESYIVDERNQSLLYPDLPKGSWVASFYVSDVEYWEKLKNEGFKGVSLEGFFQEIYEGEMIQKVFNSIKNIVFSNLPDDDKEEQIKRLLGI
jgi:hypothetical protein